MQGLKLIHVSKRGHWEEGAVAHEPLSKRQIQVTELLSHFHHINCGLNIYIKG